MLALFALLTEERVLMLALAADLAFLGDRVVKTRQYFGALLVFLFLLVILLYDAHLT